MMTCLIIGGGGFIGQWLTNSLLESGRDVIVLGRKSPTPAGLDPRARYVSCAYGASPLFDNLLGIVDEVIDLAYATVPKSSFEDPLFDLNSNLPFAVGLLQAAVNRPRLSKIVLVSSGGTVYGHAVSTPIDEDHVTNPVSPYGITKLAIEKYGLMFQRLSDVPVVIVRPGNAYGEGQLPFRGQGFIATAAASMLAGRPLTIFGGDQVVRDYIHVSDIAEGIIASLDYGQPGTCYNIGTGLGHTTNAVLALIDRHAREWGVSTAIDHKPARTFDVMVNVLDSRRLEVQSGWCAKVPLPEGVSRAWQWLAQQTKP